MITERSQRWERNITERLRRIFGLYIICLKNKFESHFFFLEMNPIDHKFLKIFILPQIGAPQDHIV